MGNELVVIRQLQQDLISFEETVGDLEAEIVMVRAELAAMTIKYKRQRRRVQILKRELDALKAEVAVYRLFDCNRPT